MLVLTRRCGEEIVIGGNIHITVVAIQGNKVRLGITAPRSVSVDRQEVHERRFVTDGELCPTPAIVVPAQDDFGMLAGR
ncbi:MAG TPA: carbon storage regulator CsrA [Gemmataceae bacterium]|nr:carbon storage regulator CsrA [Gemmataceae bacterium]